MITQVASSILENATRALSILEPRDWLLTAIALLATWILHARQQRNALPPGPPGLPIVGNVLQMPREKEWLVYDEWAKVYGPIFYLNTIGGHLFVINSQEVAAEILEKNANAYAARPGNMVMATDLIGWGRGVAINQGGEQHRKYRKLMSKVLNSTAVRKFLPLEQRAAETFLQELYRAPEDFLKHIRNVLGNMIVELSYGRDTKIGDKGYIDYAEYVHEVFSYTARSFAFAVDIVPALQYLPQWLPGMGWLRQARIWREELDVMVQIPFDMVKSDMAKEDYTDSYVSLSLDEQKESDDLKEHETDIMWTAASLYTGGTDTTIAGLTAFFLLMCLHPDIQARAQKEIDDVIGSDRLPTADDEQRLPYVGALVREVLRYWTVAPVGIPHRSTEDTVYGSYHIPKGSTIISNLWGIMHDPTVYSSPYTFNPSRFLPTSQGGLNEPDPIPTVFGFGRRICPGMHLAIASLWTFCACTLAGFTIGPERDEKGEVRMPKEERGPEIISIPKPFKCKVEPRSPATASLLGL